MASRATWRKRAEWLPVFLPLLGPVAYAWHDDRWGATSWKPAASDERNYARTKERRR